MMTPQLPPASTPSVAQTILQQLGGRHFISMTGAKNLTAHANALSFRIPTAPRNRINYVKVTLNAMDTYDVEFFTIRGANSAVKGYHEGIYADKLRGLFEDETGLRTSLTHIYGRQS